MIFDIPLRYETPHRRVVGVYSLKQKSRRHAFGKRRANLMISPITYLFQLEVDRLACF